MEKTLKLYTYVDGINDLPFPSLEEQVEVSSFTYDAKRMGGAPSISFTVKHGLCLDNIWTKKVYATFNGEKYYLKQIPTSARDNSDSRYKHDVTLVSERMILENVYFFDVVADDTTNDKPVSNSSNVVFFGDIHEFASRLQRSLQYSHLDYNVVVDEDVSSDAKLVSFNDQFFANVLQEIYNTYEIPYYFVGKTIHIGSDEQEVEPILEYGIENSLLSISKENANYKIVNRCTGDGSDVNIPYYYPNTSPYGKVKILYNGVDNGRANVSDWSRFAACGPSSTLRYVNYYSQSGQQHLASIEDFVNDDTSFSGYDNNNRPMYTWTGKCNIKIPDPKAILYFVFGFQGGEGGSISYSVYDSNNIPVAQSLLPTGQGVDLDYGSYTVKIHVEVGDRDYGGEEWAKRNVYASLAYSTYSSTTGWRLNDKKMVSLASLGITLLDTPKHDDVISFEVLEGRVPMVGKLMPSIYRETKGAERFYNAINGEYVIPGNGLETYTFSNPYVEGEPREHIVHFEDIKPTIKGMKNASGQYIDSFIEFAYDLNDNDELDAEGKYEHPYFYAKLPKFDGEYGFNLFAHAIEGNAMTISMTSGVCGACEWTIGVDDTSKLNVVQVYEEDTTDADGVFHAAGTLKRNDNGDVLRSGSAQDCQNDTRTNEVWVALKKEESTFGVLMPNVGHDYRPAVGDTFVILHIGLPEAYILAAEQRLTEEIIKYMSENNDDKFNFSVKFSRIYLEQNPDVLATLNENSRIKIRYNNNVYTLHVSSFSYKMMENTALPEVIVQLSDTLTVNRNAVQNTINEIRNANYRASYVSETRGINSGSTSTNAAIMAQASKNGAIVVGDRVFVDVLNAKEFVQKHGEETIHDVKTFNDDVVFVQKTQSDDFVRGSLTGVGWGIYRDEQGRSVAEIDKLIARQELEINELKINQATFQKGIQVFSNGGCVIEVVEEQEDRYRCFFNNEQGTFFSGFVVGDQARCQRFDESYNQVAKYYWRLVIGVSASYVDLSKTDYSGDGIPSAGDTIVQLGHRNNPDRQNAILIASYPVPTILQYESIYSYSLPAPSTKITPGGNEFSGQIVIKPGSTGLSNMDEFKGLQEEVHSVEINLENTSAEVDRYGTLVDEIKEQADKEYTIWFYDHIPTLTNMPAVEWINDEMLALHDQDLFYSKPLGRAWRFVDGDWEEVTDADTIAALRESSNATQRVDELEVILDGYGADLEVVKNQLDKEFTIWFAEESMPESYVPTNNNYPAEDWTTEALQTLHDQDIFYNRKSGKAWRYEEGAWVEITDADTIAALGKAKDAQDTADNKRRVFTEQPTTAEAYDEGDLWVNATYGTIYNNDLLRCKTSKASGAAFSIDHWELSARYTDDTRANEAYDIANESKNYIENVLPGEFEKLQNQLDGKVESFFYDYDPTTSNYPASEWTTAELKEAHLNDTFTNTESGQSWRWLYKDGAYKWVEIADTQAAEALRLAQQAQDTADGKRRVFVATPTTPYDVGDLWVQGSSGDIMRCKTARATGSYTASDWVKASKYTDDTRADEAYDKAEDAEDKADEALGALTDLEYLKAALPKDSALATTVTNAMVLSSLLGVWNSSNSVVAFLNGSDLGKHATYGKMLLASGIPSGSGTLASRAANATIRLYEDGTLIANKGVFSGKVLLGDGKITLNQDGSGSFGGGKVLFNKDGSGQLADGSIVWDANGLMTNVYPSRIQWVPLATAATANNLNLNLGGYISDVAGRTCTIPNPTVDGFTLVLRGPDVTTRSTGVATFACASGTQFVAATNNYDSSYPSTTSNYATSLVFGYFGSKTGEATLRYSTTNKTWTVSTDGKMTVDSNAIRIFPNDNSIGGNITPVRTISTSGTATLTNNDETVVITASSKLTLTLPSSPATGRRFEVIGRNAHTVVFSAGRNIYRLGNGSGSTTQTIAAGYFHSIVTFDGTYWLLSVTENS